MMERSVKVIFIFIFIFNFNFINFNGELVHGHITKKSTQHRVLGRDTGTFISLRSVNLVVVVVVIVVVVIVVVVGVVVHHHPNIFYSGC